VADWTRRDPAITAALQKYGREGVPTYVLLRAPPPTPPPNSSPNSSLPPSFSKLFPNNPIPKFFTSIKKYLISLS
jgi:thiol:disulfide interchange protein DsbD